MLSNEEDKYKVPLFDGSHFNIWKFRIKAIRLDQHELLKYVNNNYKNIVIIKDTDSVAQKATKWKQLIIHKKKAEKVNLWLFRRFLTTISNSSKTKRVPMIFGKFLRPTTKKGV